MSGDSSQVPILSGFGAPVWEVPGRHACPPAATHGRVRRCKALWMESEQRLLWGIYMLLLLTIWMAVSIPEAGPLARPRSLEQFGVPVAATRAAIPRDNPQTPAA